MINDIALIALNLMALNTITAIVTVSACVFMAVQCWKMWRLLQELRRERKELEK